MLLMVGANILQSGIIRVICCYCHYSANRQHNKNELILKIESSGSSCIFCLNSVFDPHIHRRMALHGVTLRNKTEPQCKFSRQAIDMMQKHNVEYSTFETWLAFGPAIVQLCFRQFQFCFTHKKTGSMMGVFCVVFFSGSTFEATEVRTFWRMMTCDKV